MSIDAGFSCPNRDGIKGLNGCIYCNNEGFSRNARKKAQPIEKQITEGMEIARNRYGAEKFIAYFQAYTNTYAPVSELRKKYSKIKKFKDIVGLSIGTRPDCINKKQRQKQKTNQTTFSTSFLPPLCIYLWLSSRLLFRVIPKTLSSVYSVAYAL